MFTHAVQSQDLASKLSADRECATGTKCSRTKTYDVIVATSLGLRVLKGFYVLTLNNIICWVKLSIQDFLVYIASCLCPHLIHCIETHMCHQICLVNAAWAWGLRTGPTASSQTQIPALPLTQ